MYLLLCFLASIISTVGFWWVGFFPNSASTLMWFHLLLSGVCAIPFSFWQIAASEGSATVYGHSVVEGMDQIRALSGVCPQHNLVFDSMTCLENTELVGAQKGMEAAELEGGAIEKMLIEVGLQEKLSARTGTLSGGQKRKLSMACALVGSPKFVLLDEPVVGQTFCNVMHFAGLEPGRLPRHGCQVRLQRCASRAELSATQSRRKAAREPRECGVGGGVVSDVALERAGAPRNVMRTHVIYRPETELECNVENS